ncbi:MAG: glutathione S-transferase family protein [Pseudomonadota bacterium]
MLRVLHFPLCPFSRKVRIAMREKEVEAEFTPIEPWRCDDSLLALNPAGEVPVLEDGDQVVADSAVICDYLEETRPESSLIGKTVAERAETRRLVAWFEGKFVRDVTDLVWREKLIKRIKLGETPESHAVRAGLTNLHLHLEYVSYLFDRRNWLAGEELTLADIAAAAQLSVLDYMGDVPWDRHPGAKLWYSRIKSRPSFRPLLADRMPALRPADHYADLDF